MKLGICLESIKLPLRSGLAQASKWGVAGVQVNAMGDLNPDRLTDTGRREFRNLLKTYNLELTALNCPLRKGLDVAENQQARIEFIRKTLTLAFELGPRKVIVPCPALPKESKEPKDALEEIRANLMREALLDLGRHADRVGSLLCLEIGFDSPEAVRDYLACFDIGGLQVNYDPANLLIHGHDPVKGIIPLYNRIAHVHARDARRSTISSGGQEVRLGGGDIDWLRFVATLASVEYRGFLTAERENAEDPIGDIEKGLQFLRRMMVS